MPALDDAARLLLDIAAFRADPPDALPQGLAPTSIAEAHAIQDRAMALTGEPAMAMKVVVNEEGVLRGSIPPSRIWASPATVPAGLLRLCGIETEVAFRLDRELPARATPYSAEELAPFLTALTVIEVVDTRFTTTDAPFLHRLADNLSNGGLVTGTARTDWQSIDLPNLEAVVTVNGRELKRVKAGLVFGDPWPPAVSLLNALAAERAVPAGFIVTTGSYSGLDFVAPGDMVKVEFTGFGEAEVTFAT